MRRRIVTPLPFFFCFSLFSSIFLFGELCFCACACRVRSIVVFAAGCCCCCRRRRRRRFRRARARPSGRARATDARNRTRAHAGQAVREGGQSARPSQNKKRQHRARLLVCASRLMRKQQQQQANSFYLFCFFAVRLLHCTAAPPPLPLVSAASQCARCLKLEAIVDLIPGYEFPSQRANNRGQKASKLNETNPFPIEIRLKTIEPKQEKTRARPPFWAPSRH